MPLCKQCNTTFEVPERDKVFYKKISPVFKGKSYPIPEPEHCPECRETIRMAWKNERHLYKRNCDLCGNKMFSLYSPEKPVTVYCLDCWWSDKWDPMSYARDFDFSRPFFEQWFEFSDKLPKQTLHQNNNEENCEYTTSTTRNRNCYLISSSGYNEDCYYGIFMPRNKNCIDNTHVMDSELLYECVDADRCYRLAWSQNVKDCSDSRFLYDCHGCRNCFFSYGLRNKQYVFRNKQLSKEEYEERLKGIDFTSHETVEGLKKEFQEFIKACPRLYYEGQNNENVTASNYIFNCKNSSGCFDANNLEDCHYCGWFNDSKDCQDVYAFGYGNELCYSCLQVGSGAHHLLFTMNCYDSSTDYIYCNDCHSSQNLFACEGLRRKKYCIFNKQYTKEEYEALVPKIIEHIQKRGEWGQFFSPAYSHFDYNQSMAMDLYPKSQKEVKALGWQWRELKDEMPKVEKLFAASRLPDRTADIPDDILNWAVECESSYRPFKLLPQELSFYRKNQLPIPHLHPDERHKRRLRLRNPRRVYKRQCDQCSANIKTTYSPDRPEKVYCEQCYLKEVY